MFPANPTSPNPTSEHQRGGFSKPKQTHSSNSGYGSPAEVSSQLKPRAPDCYLGQAHRHQVTQEQKVASPPPQSLNNDRRLDYKEARAPASPSAGFGPWHGHSASPLLSTDAVATTDWEEVESDHWNVGLQTQKYHCMDAPRVPKGPKKRKTLPLNHYISGTAQENGDGLLGEAFKGTSQNYLASNNAGFLSSSNSTASHSSLCLSDLSDADGRYLLCHSGNDESTSPCGFLQPSPVSVGQLWEEAIVSQKTERVQQLINYGLSASGEGSFMNKPPLILAVLTGNDAMVKLLLTAGADINCDDSEKQTPLHHAAATGNRSIVKLLLVAGANLYARTRQGLFPLQLAADGPTYQLLSQRIKSDMENAKARSLPSLLSSSMDIGWQGRPSSFAGVHTAPSDDRRGLDGLKDNIRRTFSGTLIQDSANKCPLLCRRNSFGEPDLQMVMANSQERYQMDSCSSENTSEGDFITKFFLMHINKDPSFKNSAAENTLDHTKQVEENPLQQRSQRTDIQNSLRISGEDKKTKLQYLPLHVAQEKAEDSLEISQAENEDFTAFLQKQNNSIKSLVDRVFKDRETCMKEKTEITNTPLHLEGDKRNQDSGELPPINQGWECNLNSVHQTPEEKNYVKAEETNSVIDRGSSAASTELGGSSTTSGLVGMHEIKDEESHGSGFSQSLGNLQRFAADTSREAVREGPILVFEDVKDGSTLQDVKFMDSVKEKAYCDLPTMQNDSDGHVKDKKQVTFFVPPDDNLLLVRADWHDAARAGCIGCGKEGCGGKCLPCNGYNEKEPETSDKELAASSSKKLFKRAETKKTKSFEWKRGELLGEGAYGKVFCGLNQSTGELMAVKQLKLGNSTNDQEKSFYLATLEREISLYKNMRYKHIVGYIDMDKDEISGYLYIFLEYVSGGSIQSMLERFGRFSEPLVRVYTRQLLLGLEYLHKNRIVHRDIKGGNVLVDSDGVVKLADFGASKAFHEATVTDACRSIRGSIFWMAPEVIKGDNYGRHADIWSVGCTVIEMLTAMHPWPGIENSWAAIFQIAKASSGPPIPETASDCAKEFLAQCFHLNPKLRPSASKLLEHPFVTIAQEQPQNSQN